MFRPIYIAICLFLLVIGIFFARKIRKARNVRIVILSVIILIWFTLCGIFFMYPIENLIFSFQSPQEVFQYTAQGKIIDIVEGETSCVIIYQQGENSYSMVFCTKRSGKYKIATAVGYHHNDFASKNGSLRVYEMKDSKDSYVVGVITIEEAEMKITDNDGSQYHNFLLHESDNGFYTYYVYGYTNNTVEESLTLSLNGSELILKKI